MEWVKCGICKCSCLMVLLSVRKNHKARLPFEFQKEQFFLLNFDFMRITLELI
jgi:hypothetical protein